VGEIILESKTPEEYIENSLKSKLRPAEKAKLALAWMDATGYTKEDILYARNRNPYWKRKKWKEQRNVLLADFLHTITQMGAPIVWTRELLEEFVELNKKDSGRSLFV